MAANTLSENITLAIKNADGSSFYNLSLKKFTIDSQVMSLGDKITGDVYYKDNNLPFTMREYVEYDGVKYTLVNPPTVVKEGMVRDNSENKGMTKYSLEFYHPMYQLGNIPFNDVAVSYNESSYMSESATFRWVGYPDDYIAKLNKNLQGTQWIVVKSSNFPSAVESQISEVLDFDKGSIADALKKMYETWELPYVVDKVGSSESSYAQGKRFKVIVGMPSAEIYEQGSQDPFVFQYGQGVGLKNNSRSPRNNKIITRIAGYGSERNIPYGYPQIVWTGSASDSRLQYPLYDGIVGGQPVKLIKHPFTRKTLMPSIYVETVNRKVNPNASGYNPNTEIIEYYDATAAENYPNPINPLAPSYETHEFEDIYPRLDSASIVGVVPSDKDAKTYVPFGQIDDVIDKYIDNSSSYYEKDFLWECKGMVITNGMEEINYDKNVATHSFVFTLTHDDTFLYLEYKSNDLQNFKFTALRYGVAPPTPAWDDTMDDKGEYTQSYMEITLPVLGFDIYACASITEQMQINMRSGACIGCTFDVVVDWDDYKKNFFNADGDFVPDGAQRDLVKYPKSNVQSITVTAKKDLETFGTLMPNRYQQPQAGDEFVILGISLPLSYIQSAEEELADAAKAYMRENNIYYFDYPLKFDEFFLHNNDHILSQIKPNAIVHFNYAGDTKDLYIKQLTTKVGYAPLPQFDITLTDNIEVSLNQIGQTVDELGKLSDVVALLRRQTEDGLLAAVMSKLSKTDDDTANGLIRFMKGLQIGRSFSSGILGSGGIIGVDADGKTYLEVDEIYARIKAVFDNVEVKNYQHSVGNRMVTKAGIKCSRVEWVGENGEYIEQNQANLSSVVSFRCFYRAKDADDTVNNDFVAGVNEEDGKGTQDLAFCDSTNIASGVNKRSYWRAVVGKNANGTFTLDGEGWIDLSKADCRANSDIPMAGDDIIQLGNVTDKDRQGAIVEYIGGNDAPCYKIYQEIGLDERTDEEKEQGVVFNPYVLTDKCFIDFGYSRTTKRAYMNVYGDMYVGEKGNNPSTYIRYTQPHKEWVTPEPTEEVPEPEPELMTIPAKLEIKAVIDASSPISGTSSDSSTLGGVLSGLQKQIDGAIETWFYNGSPMKEEGGTQVVDETKEPYKTWYQADHGGTEEEVATERLKHLGDLYYDNETGYAYRFANSGTEQAPQFTWLPITDSAVVKALEDAKKALDTAEGKRSVYTGWNDWMKTIDGASVNTLEVGDLFIPTENTTQGGFAYKANKVYKCTQKGQNSFQEVAYTDDTKFDGYINQVLNGTGATGDTATVANAIRVIKGALNEATVIDGGLVLTSLINLRSNNKTWAGISGQYDNKTEEQGGAKGHGIAAWYGGAMVDKEVATTATDYAKSLFRFDGSGYLAGGNIKWTADGRVYLSNIQSQSGQAIDQYFFDAFGIGLDGNVRYINPNFTFSDIDIVRRSGNTYTITGNSVLNRNENDARYLLLDKFFSLFDIYNGSTNYTNTFRTSGLPQDTSNISIKAKFGFWTDQFLSALGKNDSGGGGGVGDVTWEALAAQATDGRTIHSSYITDALSGYATKSWVGLQGYITSAALIGYATEQWVTDNFNKYVLPAATANALGGIKVGYTTSGKNYKIQLDANDNAFVNVPWENTTYTLADLMGSAAKGGLTQPIYWDGSKFANTTYTLGKSVPTDAKFTDTTYSNGTGITLTGTEFSITEANVSTILNLLSEGTSTAETDDYLIAQYAGGGTTTTTYHRRKVSNVVNSTIVKAALGVGTGTSKYLREDGTWVTPVDNNTTYKLTVNGTTNGDSVNGTNLGSLYAIATSDATLASQVWMRNANNTGYAWRQLGTRAFDSTAYLPLTGGTLTGNLTTTNIIVPSGNTIKIGDAYLKWDSANNAVKVYKLNGSTEVAVNFYATGGVSALGMSDSGGGGGVGDVTWEALAGNTNEQINASHLTTALSGYATQSWVTSRGYITSYTDTKNTAGATNLASKKLFIIGAQSQDANPQTYSYVNCFIGTDGCLYSNGTKVLTSYTEQYTGTVTSIGITVPTGFSVTPATITTNGTFAITYANGYEGFTTALKSKISKLDDMFTLEGSGTSSDPYIIKANYGLYTDYFLSALGLNSSGGGGGSSTLEDLLDVEFAGTPSNGQVLKYNSSTGKWYNGNDNNTGTVTSIKVGTTSYNPSNGVVSLPAYPTTLPASDVSAWAKAATKPSYTLDEVSDGTTRKLANYLPLSGGTMTGVLTLLGSQYNAYDTGVGALNLNNSDITGVNSILSADLSENWKESIGFKRTNGNYDTFRAADGTFYFGVNNGTEYTAIHSGNWSSHIGTSSSPVAYAASASVCTGNAATATKLATARSLWGNSFDGSADITGDFSSRGDIYARGNYGGFMLARGLASNEAVRIEALDANGDWASQGLTLMQNGNIGIGTNTPSTKLEVIGNIKATKFYFTDSVYLEYSSTNGVHLVGAGFYTDYFVSALGLNNSGSSGGAVSSVCGYIGDVTAAQVGSALTSAGYSLTDTNTWRPITDSYNVNSPSSSTSLSQAGAKALYTAITGGYLPLTGGTLSKGGGTPLTIKNSSSAGVNAYINFADVNGNSLGKIGADSGIPKFVSGDGAHTYTIYHSGNLTNVSQLTNDAGYVTSSGSVNYATSAGSAATATSATNSSYAGVLRDPYYYVYPTRRTSGDFTVSDGGVHYYLATSSMTTGSARPADGYILHLGWDNAAFDSQMWIANIDSSANAAGFRMGVRHHENGTWGAYRYFIDSSNIGSQSVAYATSAGSATDSTKVAKSGDTMTGILYLSGANSYISFAPTGDTVHEDYPLFVGDNGLLHFGGDTVAMISDIPTGGSGTVTSIATGTGLTGGTITTSGTISINSTYQTYISHGNTAYGWGNHANAGYLTSMSYIYFNDSSYNPYMMLVHNGTYFFFQAYQGSVGFGPTWEKALQVTPNGDASATSWTNRSDIRKKNVISYGVEPTVESVSHAPAIRFRWNDSAPSDRERLGTIAQYWKTVTPECVIADGEGYLSMQYDVIALLAAISVAKKVVNHEERITELERENERLRNEINELKAE